MSDKLCAPNNFRVTPRDGAAVSEWDAVSGADGYRLYFYCADSPDRCIKTRYAQDPKKTILGFTNGREYLVSVCAFRSDGDREVMGEQSEKLAFTPISEKLKAQNTVCLKTGESAQLSWEYKNTVPEAKFRSEDENVAVVDDNGKVTAVSAGATYIEITSGELRCRTKIAVDRRMSAPAESAVLMFAGDIMCAVNHQRAAAAYGYDFHDAFSSIKPVLAQSDFAAGVLETTCFDGAPYENEEVRLAGGSPNCNSPSSFVSAVADAGFDALVTANNHNCDTGREGLEATVEAIRRCGMKNLGTLGDNPVIVDVKGIKVGIISVSMISNGIDEQVTGGSEVVNIIGRYDRDYFLELINNAYRSGAEYIVAYQHWGSMNSAKVRRVQTEEARFMADAGASLIVGSHPHVVQRFSYIKTSDGRRVPCAFSLGNFLTTMQEMKENRDSVLLRVELTRTEDGISAKLSYIPCMSETRDFGAAVVPVYPAFGKESAESFARTKQLVGAALGHFEYRPRVLLSGSLNLNRIFGSGRGFRVDKTGLLLSQISLGRQQRFAVAEDDDSRVTIDLEGSFSDYIVKSKPDFVAVDFCTAATVSCYKLSGEDNCFFTGSKRFKASDFFREHKNELEKIRPPFGESIWKPMVRNYAEGLLRAVSHERIILFRSRFGTQRAKGSELRSASSPQNSLNRFLTAMEDYFISIANPAIVDLSADYFPDSEQSCAYEPAYYADAYNAAKRIAEGRGVTAVRVSDVELWFDRAMKYYRNMTARAYQSWLLDMSNAADIIIAQTCAEFAAKNRERLIRLKLAGHSDLAYVREFFVDEPAAADLVQAAEIIRELLRGNLNKPYDFYSLAFKERFNIRKTMVRLLSQEIGAAVNESSVELVFLLRGKPQLKRYIAGLSRLTVDIWGSCVSRESINRSKDAYIGKYIFKQAPILAFEQAIDVEFPEGTDAFCGNAWRRRTMQDAFCRNGMDIIADSESRWLLVDFYDLICKMAEYHGGLFETDDFICRTDFYKSIESECKECYLFEKRDMKYCFEAVTRFANRVSEKYGSNIILIKTEPKNSYVTLDDRLAPLEDDGMFEIKKKFISLCEERFASVTGCYVIDISKHFYSSDSFPLGGAHIVHYEEEFYRQTGEYISEILLGTDRRVFSTVDDNYLLLRSLKLNRE